MQYRLDICGSSFFSLLGFVLIQGNIGLNELLYEIDNQIFNGIVYLY